jgi:hypothetical protein
LCQEPEEARRSRTEEDQVRKRDTAAHKPKAKQKRAEKKTHLRTENLSKGEHESTECDNDDDTAPKDEQSVKAVRTKVNPFEKRARNKSDSLQNYRQHVALFLVCR